MKKLSLVTAAIMGLLSTSAATAQSTVTIYGLLDGGYNHITGLRNGTANRIDSGIMEGSRFGLRGSEDIGGGYKAIFTLENRLELDTGSVSNRAPSGGQIPDRLIQANRLTPTLSAAQQAGLQPLFNTVAYGNAAGTVGTAGGIGAGVGVNVSATPNLFDRQAYAGLVTPFGAFTLGRQYTPAYLVGASFDASQTQSSLSVGQVAPTGIDIRLGNTVQYGIQAAGVTAALLYGAGEVAGNSSASRFYGGMVIYKGNGFSLGYGHNERKNSLGQKSLTNNVFGGTVDLGPGTLYGQYTTIKDENPETLVLISPAFAAAGPLAPTVATAYANALQQDARQMHIGYKLTSGVHTVVVAYNRLDDKRPNNADTTSYGTTYTFALSKRTNLNAVLTRFNNTGSGQAAPGGGGFLGGVTSAAGVGSTNVAFGIRHTF